MPFGEEEQCTWAVMPQSFAESPSYFSQTLKVDLEDTKLTRSSALLQYSGTCFSDPLLRRCRDSIHLFRLLALKERKVSMEKLQFAQTLV